MAQYILEIEDVPSMLKDGYAFFRIVDAPWYISDEVINRLKPYEDAKLICGADMGGYER